MTSISFNCSRQHVSQGISLLQVTPNNLDEVVPALHNGEITFAPSWTASIPTPVPRLDRLGAQAGCDPPTYKLARQAWDKALPEEFKQQRLAIPQAICDPIFQEAPNLQPKELNSLAYFLHQTGSRGWWKRCDQPGDSGSRFSPPARSILRPIFA
jgi:hypothetical protein